MGCLKIVDSDLTARDVSRDRQHRYAVALAIKKPVDQMQVARTAASGAYRKAPSEMSFSARREGSRLLMPHMDPVNRFSPSHHVRETVERVTDDAINPLDTGLLQGFDKKFSGCPAHVANSPELNGVILQDAEIGDGVRHAETVAPADPQRRDQVHLLALYFGHTQFGRAAPHVHDGKIIRERHRQLVHGGR